MKHNKLKALLIRMATAIISNIKERRTKTWQNLSLE